MVKFESGRAYHNTDTTVKIVQVYRKTLKYRQGKGPVTSTPIKWVRNRKYPEHPIQVIVLKDGSRIYATKPVRGKVRHSIPYPKTTKTRARPKKYTESDNLDNDYTVRGNGHYSMYDIDYPDDGFVATTQSKSTASKNTSNLYSQIKNTAKKTKTGLKKVKEKKVDIAETMLEGAIDVGLNVLFG